MSNFITDTFFKQREEFNQMALDRANKLPFPDGVEEITNIAYAKDYPEVQRLDIFRPKEMENKILPVIVDVHGGGMILGNKEFNRYFCAQISAMGYLVFSIEFRLVPEYQVYDQFSDISAAMDYIQTIIPQYHGDSEHVYLVADSGGAFLSTYTVAMQKSPALALAAKVKPSTLKIQAMGLISGMFYTTKPDKIGVFMPKYLYGKNYKRSAFAPYVNPEHPDIVTSLPPCYLITSENDNLKHYTLHFEKALTKHNAPHTLMCYPKNEKLTHAFSVFEPYMEESIDAVKAMLHFLRKY